MRLSLLLPARKHVEDAAVVATWLARGDRGDDSTPGRLGLLRENFAVAGDTLPVAALTRSIDANDAADALWLRADPAFVMADAVTLRLLACGNLVATDEEVAAFAAALKPLFAEAGLEFDAPHPQRWYLRCPREAKLPKFSSPEDALGDDLGRHLPAGDEARRWRSLLNEAQIVLTQHAANARRAQRGLPPVNSLWLWGPGLLPQSVVAGFARVYSDDEVVVALAEQAKVETSGRLAEGFGLLSLPSSGQGLEDAGASVLIDLAQYRDAARLESDWLAPIDAALKNRRIARVDLCFESGERRVVKPAHRWRFWRRAKTPV